MSTGVYLVEFVRGFWLLYDRNNVTDPLGADISRDRVIQWALEMASARGYGMKRKPVVEVYDREGRLEMKLTPKDNAA